MVGFMAQSLDAGTGRELSSGLHAQLLSVELHDICTCIANATAARPRHLEIRPTPVRSQRSLMHMKKGLLGVFSACQFPKACSLFVA